MVWAVILCLESALTLQTIQKLHSQISVADPTPIGMDPLRSIYSQTLQKKRIQQDAVKLYVCMFIQKKQLPTTGKKRMIVVPSRLGTDWDESNWEIWHTSTRQRKPDCQEALKLRCSRTVQRLWRLFFLWRRHYSQSKVV